MLYDITSCLLKIIKQSKIVQLLKKWAPDKHLHISRPQAEVHHLHQASQDLQGRHQDLSSKALLPCLFVEHLSAVPLTVLVRMGSVEVKCIRKSPNE